MLKNIEAFDRQNDMGKMENMTPEEAKRMMDEYLKKMKKMNKDQ
jgi:hypothetical protein